MTDLTDQIFGKLKVLGIVQYDKSNKNRTWMCECTCTGLCVIRESDLRSGHTKSCGCLKLEKISRQRKINEYIDMGDYYKGYTYDNKEFLIDKEDFDKVSAHSWCCSRGYMETRTKQKVIRMHRLIMGVSNPKEKIDHINHNKSDNRRKNLRTCTHMENCSNNLTSKNNTSGQTGVIFHKGKWEVRIKHNYKNFYLGRFDTFEKAVEARIAKEIELFGEFSPHYKKEDS